MSTLVTERRRPLDNDDGQESLFGGEAFALSSRAPAAWQRSAAEREAARTAPPEAGATAPLDEAQAGMFEAHESVPFDAAPAGTFEAHVSASLDEAQAAAAFEGQAEVEYESGPSAEDLAAYALEAGSGADLLVGPVPTEVPAHGADVELEALERATVAADDVRKPRALVAGPTLDDVMSRVWEGLVTGLPAACPVCHGEVVSSFAGSVHGSCSSCGTTIE
jgi:hypothetical protein